MKRVTSSKLGTWYYDKVDNYSIIINKEIPELSGYIDITGNYWSLAFIKKGQDFYFNSNLNAIYPAKSGFVLFMPPFSIYELNTTCETIADIFISKIPINFFNYNDPMIFDFKNEISTDFYLNFKKLEKELINPKSISLKTGKSQIAHTIKGLIDQNFEDGIKLSDICKELKMTSYNLTRHFKREFLIKPSKYFTDVKLHSASIDMLFNGKDTNITSTAFNSGFNDLSRFNKLFKQKYGKTPKVLKK